MSVESAILADIRKKMEQLVNEQKETNRLLAALVKVEEFKAGAPQQPRRW